MIEFRTSRSYGEFNDPLYSEIGRNVLVVLIKYTLLSYTMNWQAASALVSVFYLLPETCPAVQCETGLHSLEEEAGDHLVSDTSGLGKRKENVIGKEA